ncbi:hypothetical protein R3P38DRAFT_3440427 [Favolaschia claudopus]|uniref:DDE-1 domain-containing protein n=1 Tax=Favolaschia claudopus TaxID=2862362 RepID=A0AAW0CW85_9AGAR
MAPTKPSDPKGIPRELNTRLKYLSTLLKHLPDSLPLNLPQDETTYHFFLDSEDVNEEGKAYAFNRRLEVAFQTHKLRKLVFRERGDRVADLETFLRKIIKEDGSSEGRGHQARWIERLVTAAVDSGAKMPAKKRAANDSDDDTNAKLTTNLGSHPKKARKTTTIDLTEDTPGPKTTTSSTSSSAPAAPALPASESAQTGVISNPPPAAQDVPVASNHSLAPLASSTPSTAAANARPLQQGTLFQFGAKKLGREEANLQWKRQVAESREKMAAAALREKEAKEERVQEKKDLNRERQQRFRDRKKAQSGNVTKKAKAMVLGTQKRTLAEDVNVAEVSRPEGMKWKAGRTGKKNGVIHKRHQRVNWYHPFLWSAIDAVAPHVGWSPTMIVKALQRKSPDIYGRLNKGTVQKWISKSGWRWSTRTQKNVARRHALAGTGRRVGVLSPYPELVTTIKTKLEDLRKSGVSVGRLLTRSIILAIIQKKQPDLLKKGFKCSESYVSGFLESVTDWSLRHGTRAAAQVPDNVNEVCEQAFFRIVHLATFYDIPPQLIINMDQTGVMLMVANNKTYNPKGAKQVDIHGRDEKRAYTLAVWSGKSKLSLPHAYAEGMDRANELGFDFAFAQSKKATSHFSTLKTMEEYVLHVVVPWIQKQIKLLGLDDDQKAILFLDFYPTQTGRDLIKRAWEKCSVGEFNLGEECLKSRKTKAAYREYLLKNPDFRKEIEDKIGKVVDVDEEAVAAAAATEESEVAAMPVGEDDVFTRDDTDSTEIPLRSVVQAALQVDIPPQQLPATDVGTFCVSLDTVCVDGSGMLKASGEMENIWAYNDNGRPWSEGNLANETFAKS